VIDHKSGPGPPRTFATNRTSTNWS